MTAAQPTPEAPMVWPFTSCPNCRGRDFVVDDVDLKTIFTCLSCASTWRYLLGYLVSVDTSTP